jgi:hypothetical protein
MRPWEGDKDKDGNIAYNTGFVFAPRPLFPKYFLPAVNHPLNTLLKAEDSYSTSRFPSDILDIFILVCS